jgi:hypothetical protein
MKLELYGLIQSLLEAGGKFDNGFYVIRDRVGQCHRDDGPAIICPDGRQYWYQNGNLHRDDGPAVIYPDGEQEWHLNGVFIREGE